MYVCARMYMCVYCWKVGYIIKQQLNYIYIYIYIYIHVYLHISIDGYVIMYIIPIYDLYCWYTYTIVV